MKSKSKTSCWFFLTALLIVSSCGGPAKKENDDNISTKAAKTDFYVEIPYDGSTYADLIAMYNQGRFDEFYEGLDSTQTEYRMVGESDFVRAPGSDNPIFQIEVQQDSALVRQLLFDADMKLTAVGINQMLAKGSYTIEYNYQKLFDDAGSGVYYFLTKIGLSEKLSRITVLK
jgi:hypothetical protein